MWMGSPLLTSSVVKTLRKSCAVKVSPANSGLVGAGPAEALQHALDGVGGPHRARRAELPLDKNGIGLLQTRSCLS